MNIDIERIEKLYRTPRVLTFISNPYKNTTLEELGLVSVFLLYDFYKEGITKTNLGKLGFNPELNDLYHRYLHVREAIKDKGLNLSDNQYDIWPNRLLSDAKSPYRIAILASENEIGLNNIATKSLNSGPKTIFLFDTDGMRSIQVKNMKRNKIRETSNDGPNKIYELSNTLILYKSSVFDKNSLINACLLKYAYFEGLDPEFGIAHPVDLNGDYIDEHFKKIPSPDIIKFCTKSADDFVFFLKNNMDVNPYLLDEKMINYYQQIYHLYGDDLKIKELNMLQLTGYDADLFRHVLMSKTSNVEYATCPELEF